MKIVTLIENHAETDLQCEHGLSFHIEYEGKTFLLDAGQSDLFLSNAQKMGIDLKKTDYAVLSHAHYDHAGGFEAFSKRNRLAPVYMQKDAVNGCFSRKADGMKDIGIPGRVYESLGERIRYVDGDFEICEGVRLLAHHSLGLEKRGQQMHMYQEVGGKKQFDDFSHEQSLVFELADGLVVFNSCSHGGVDLILEEVQAAYPGKRILAMIGGFHLMGSDGPESMRESEKDVRRLGEKLAQTEVKHFFTGHCTGTKAYPILKEVLGDKLQLLVTGLIICEDDLS